MDYIGKNISHKLYGSGTIIEQSGRLITVNFPMHGRKVFRRKDFEKNLGIEDATSTEVRKFLNERKIRKLFHFTRLENLNSILTKGILSIEELSKQNIIFQKNDLQRLDGLFRCSSISIEYPNIRLLSRFRYMYSDSDWVILQLGTDLLGNHKNYYSKYNAGSNEMRNSMESNITSHNLKGIYSESFDVKLASGIKRCSRKGLEKFPYLPTSDQAEVLVEGRISPGEIKRIIFQEEKHMSDYINDRRCRSIELAVNEKIFHTYRDKYQYFEER